MVLSVSNDSCSSVLEGYVVAFSASNDSWNTVLEGCVVWRSVQVMTAVVLSVLCGAWC